jgi:hypothetical protein
MAHVATDDDKTANLDSFRHFLPSAAAFSSAESIRPTMIGAHDDSAMTTEKPASPQCPSTTAQKRERAAAGRPRFAVAQVGDEDLRLLGTPEGTTERSLDCHSSKLRDLVLQSRPTARSRAEEDSLKSDFLWRRGS